MTAPGLAISEQIFWYGTVVLQIALLVKLFVTKLSRVYRWFAIYLGAEVVQFALLLPFKPNKNTYGYIWFCTEPLLWILHVLIVLELYKLVLGNYPGISSLGRWAFIAAVSIAVVVSVLSLSPDLSNPNQLYRALLYFSVVQRAVFSSVALFLIVITGLLVWYPLPLNRNTVVFSMAYVPYFLGKTAALVVRNVAGPNVILAVSTVLLAIEVGCLLVWFLNLSRRGEERKVVVGHQWKPGDDERLVAQLNSVNRTLLRAGRK